MNLTSVKVGDYVEIEPCPGTLRIVGSKQGRTVQTYALNDSNFERECIEVTGFKVIAHYAKLKSKAPSTLVAHNVVSVSKGGRIFQAVLLFPDGDMWRVQPLTKGITYFRVAKRDIQRIYQARTAAPWIAEMHA